MIRDVPVQRMYPEVDSDLIPKQQQQQSGFWASQTFPIDDQQLLPDSVEQKWDVSGAKQSSGRFSNRKMELKMK